MPDYHVIPTLELRGTGLVPRSEIDATPIEPQQLTTAATGMPIALALGRVRIGARITQPIPYGTDFLVPCVIGQGVIQGIEAIEIDNKPLPAGVSYAIYTGTLTQGVDPWLAAAWLDVGKVYTDTLPGIAYVVLRFPRGADYSFESVNFIVQGLKVFDPRDGTQTQGVASTYKYSQNPVLHEAFFLNEPGIGPEETLDWASVATCASVADEMCGTEKRRIMGLYIDQQQEVGAIEETIRAHAGIFIVREAGVVRFVADAPAASVFHFTKGKYRLDSVVITKRGRANAATVVFVKWTDTTVRPWKEIDDVPPPAKASGVDAGTTPWIESRVPLPGIQQPGQASREQIRRLNEFELSDLTVKFIALDEGGAKVMKGDVFELSDVEGFVQKPFRCIDSFPVEPGRWQIVGTEYQVAVYSDSIATGPSIPDTSAPNPLVIAAPTLLVVNEVIYLEKALVADGLGRAFIYQSRFEISWTAAVHAFPLIYRVEVWDGAKKIADGMTVANLNFTTPAVQQAETYTIKVFSRSVALGVESAIPLTGTQVALGKLLPPGDVPAITRAQEIGGEIYLEWTPAIDIDVLRYEWRYTPNVTGGGSWASATLIDRIDGLRAFFKGLPVGLHRFYVKAIDSGGAYSANAVTTDLTVNTDADAFLQAHEFAAPISVTNFLELPPLEGVWRKRWATHYAADAFTTTGADPFDYGGGAAVITDHSSASICQWIGDIWDLGALVTGDWVLTPNFVDLSGTALFGFFTSPDNVTYTFQTGVSWKGSARYVAPIIQSAAGTGTVQINAPPIIALSAITRKEASDPAAPVTSNAATPKTITLSSRYVKFVKINIVPRGVVARSYTLDNIVPGLGAPNTFDVYLWDQAGAQVASQFDWSIEGY